uniref:Neurotransmitter-gated ion-channel ligand-binding domain-containing protein n=1 Tax=Odontella aurita TaxID=265563 RepID=A0A7S4JZS1_9STRA|mmetsp:Transcript_57493/g.171528  ORF Transcript_57493/g.171528 Transcript_57493/m.171528 type:complete len:646 (+) Transcript_57493:287-2224(+)
MIRISAAACAAVFAFTATRARTSALPSRAANVGYPPEPPQSVGVRPSLSSPVVFDAPLVSGRWDTLAERIAAAAVPGKNDRSSAGMHQHSSRGRKGYRHARSDGIGEIVAHGAARHVERRFVASISESSRNEGKGGASQRLRANLLSDYDRRSYPWEEAWRIKAISSEEKVTADNRGTIRKGLKVEVGINFHRIFDVSLTHSSASFVVWFRQRWTDPRLAWDPADYSNITTLHFWVGEGSGPGGKTSEIWTPDIGVWNMETSLADSLTDTSVLVDYKGSVFWSRPGRINSVCKFRGLDAFPFDTLQCTVEIGSWAHSGLYIRSVLLNEGYSVGGSETAGEAFAEYKLEKIQVKEHVYPPFVGAPEDDWPVLLYDVTFRRSWKPYVRGYISLQIMLNLVSFACFWLPPQCGERMGLAIISMLAAVTSELVVSANLPNSSEVTWFARFSLTSLAFAAVTLFETAAVIYFYYCTYSDLIPLWMKWLLVKWPGWGVGHMPKGSTGNEMPETNASSDNAFHTKMPSMVGKAGSEPLCAMDEEESSDGNRKARLDNQRDINISEDKPSRSHAPGIIYTADQNILSRNGLRSSVIRRKLKRDASDCMNQVEAENNSKWQNVAMHIDDVSRVVVPLAYAIALAVLMGPNADAP